MFPLEDEQKTINITGYAALCGGLLFWVGAYLAIVEALNEGKDLSSVMQDAIEDLSQHPKHVAHYVNQKSQNDNIKPTAVFITTKAVAKEMKKEKTQQQNKTKWRWLGYDPKSAGYWASLIQFTGATFFTISVIAITPGVVKDSQWQLQQALIWSMQIIGAWGFIISSLILMMEEQEAWYLPAWKSIGWQSAFWNLIGAIGFELSPIFGLLANWQGKGPVCCQFWGTDFNTYYGSWAFLISSVLMLVEVMNKQPVSMMLMVERTWLWLKWRVGVNGGGGGKKKDGSKVMGREENGGDEGQRDGGHV